MRMGYGMRCKSDSVGGKSDDDAKLNGKEEKKDEKKDEGRKRVSVTQRRMLLLARVCVTTQPLNGKTANCRQ